MNVNEYKSKVQAEAEAAHLDYNGRSTCCMSVGLGKAKLAINRITKHFERKLEPKIIFTTAREVYIKNFLLEIDKFCIDPEYTKTHMTFCCNRSLKNYEQIAYDLIVVDESHKEIDAYLNFLEKVKLLNPKVEILCLTGTPKLGKEYETLYNLVPISYKKKIDLAIEENLLNEYRIHIFNYSFTGKEYETYLFWKKKYDDYRNSGKRAFSFEMQKLKLILNNSKSKLEYGKYLLQKLKNKKLLIYAGSIDQSSKLYCPTYHSKLDKQERKDIYESFYEDEFLHLANVGGLKESVSIPNLTHGLFLNIDASKTSMEQAIGRFCRLSIDLVSHVIILCAENTIEKDWLEKALGDLDQKKIKNYNFDEWIKL